MDISSQYDTEHEAIGDSQVIFIKSLTLLTGIPVIWWTFVSPFVRYSHLLN